MRRLSLFLVLGLVIISLVGCGEIKTQEKATADNNKVAVEDSEKAKESKGATTEKVGLVLKSEKLHNSDNQPPEKSVLVKTQEEIIKDIDQAKLTEAKKTLHEIHMYFEGGFIFESENWIKKLSDPESPGWVFWERTGIIEIPGYTEKVDNQKDGDTYIEWLEDVKQAFTDERLRDDINPAQELIRYAVDNHDIKGLWYAHQVLHDLDYWILNYPIHFPKGKPAPPDWKGVDTYFGVTKTLEGSYPSEIEKLLQD